MAYLDTSVLGSYYCPEALSPAVSAALRSASHPAISWLSEVEFFSLLSLKVRTGHMKAADADAVRRLFLKHRSQQLFHIEPLTDRHFARAAAWLGRLSTPLRTLDALHLALAAATAQEIWTTDKPLAAAARTLRIACRLIAS